MFSFHYIIFFFVQWSDTKTIGKFSICSALNRHLKCRPKKQVLVVFVESFVFSISVSAVCLTSSNILEKFDGLVFYRWLFFFTFPECWTILFYVKVSKHFLFFFQVFTMQSVLLSERKAFAVTLNLWFVGVI